MAIEKTKDINYALLYSRIHCYNRTVMCAGKFLGNVLPVVLEWLYIYTRELT